MGFGSGGGGKFGSGRGDVDGDLTVRGTTPKLTIGDGGEEDTMLVFDGAAQDYRIGIDDGTDTLEIGHGDAHGTRAAIIINSDGDVTKIGTDTHTSGQFLKFDGSKFVLSATSGGTADSIEADNITTGDAAVTLATSTGNITVDAQGNNTDIIFKGTDGGSDTTFLTLDGSDAGTAVFNHDIHLDSDASILAFGDNQEITLTHEHNVGLILEGNGVTECPVLTLKNTNNDATGGTLKFLKDGGNVADDDVVGNITFVSEDDGDNAHTYASIVGSIADMTAGAEGGRIELKVAEHDGTVTTGLKLQDGNANGEIDVTVGAGASSVTTIAGTLTMGSTAAMTNAGLLSVGNQSNVTGTGALDSGSITSGFGAIDNGTSGIRTSTFTAETSFVPDAQDGASLGTSSLQFSDLFLADGAVCSFGDDNEITLTHEHNVGLILEGNGVTECPVLTLKNTNNDATGGTLKFLKDGANVADDDVVGNITFVSEDDGDNAHTYASIVGSIADMTGGAEGGRIELKVAEHDGTVTTGLKLQDGNADGEIDVTVGAGASSVTTIAGTLTMGSTAAMTNAGLLSVGNQSNVTGTGALDSGSITSGFGNIDIGSSSLAAGSLDVSDGNITNVGDISLDSISSDGSLVTINGPLEVANASDAGATALLIDNDEVDNHALHIEAANTTVDVIQIDATALTTGKVIDIDATGGTCVEGIKISQTYTDTTAVTSTPGICALHIDYEKSGNSTGNDNLTGIFIDMDNTTANGGDITMRGLHITPTLTLDTANSDTPKVIGAEFTVTGGTTGANTIARGLDLTITGGDFNQGIHVQSSVGGSGTSPVGNHLKLMSGASANDNLQISVMSSGETLFKTNDGSAAAAHLHILADGNLTLDAEGDMIFDAKGNDFNFKADGTEVLRITNSSSDVIIKPTVQEKDIIFQNSDGEETARIVDSSADASETAPISNTIPLASGFGYNRPCLLIDASLGARSVTLTQEISGYLILLNAAVNDIAITLPAISSDALIGMHYEFVVIAPVNGTKTITIKTAGAGDDNNDNFFLHNVTTGGTRSFDGDGDTLTIVSNTAAGAYIECTAITSDSDPSSAGTPEEVWLAKSVSSLAVTCGD